MSENCPDRFIEGEVVVGAPRREVWDAWTTAEGVRSFFAPACNVDLRVGGAYEMFFDLEAEPGSRGGEGVTLLAIQPERMLSFTWNAPPRFPGARTQYTHVVVRFFEEDEDRTRVRLRHDGWGEGGEWDETFDYFKRAWLEVVLPRLVHRFADGLED